MESSASDRPCTREGCQVLADGVCAAGNEPPDKCPNRSVIVVGDLDVYDSEDDAGTASSTAAEERLPLPSGEALDTEDVSLFLRSRPATFIAVVGDKDSGKSTLLCALYDRFLRGPFSGFSFVGSRSLIAFERRSHYSRLESGRSVPDTPRTSISEGLKYFHLALCTEGAPSTRRDVLFSDRAGETYSRARGNSTIIESLVEIPQADSVVVLMDGRRVADPLERSSALQSVRQTLRAFLDNGALTTKSVVDIVTTKCDLIAADKESAAIDQALRLFEDRLRVDFTPRLRALSFWQIAARDPAGKLSPGHGLDKLITHWLRTEKLTSPAPPPLEKRRLRSEFDRLLLRTR
jgi:hypothetical protein